MHDTTQVSKACQIPNTKINNNTNNYEFTKIYSKIEDNNFLLEKHPYVLTNHCMQILCVQQCTL
jgi:hypothetical protein